MVITIYINFIPRSNINRFPYIGSNPEIAKKLRTLKNGKLLTQKGPDGKDYPPYNTFGVPILGHRPGVDPTKLFAFGDPRGNQDWVSLI
jgi:peroxidase